MVHAVWWFMPYSGSCSSVDRGLYTVQWFMQFGGSCLIVVHAVQWIVQVAYKRGLGRPEMKFIYAKSKHGGTQPRP